jgi:hypothetical protein
MMVHGGLCLAYAALHYRRDTLTGSRASAGRGAGYFDHYSVREEEEFYRKVEEVKEGRDEGRNGEPFFSLPASYTYSTFSTLRLLKCGFM